MPRRLLKLLPPSLTALLAWTLLPGTFLDRALLSISSRALANPPFFTTGGGTHGNPYALRTLRESYKTVPSISPTNITISDDAEKVFQSSPPSPVDFAIILKNLRRLGTDSVAITMPLAWTEPDLISLVALDQQLDAFPAPITSAPLSRNPIPTPLPPAFRRASIPISNIHGKTSALPIVNRIPIPDVILGNKTSLAGFTLLESETLTSYPHLIARWDDRVVFSVLLLAALDHFDKSIDSITIRLGEYISFGNDGPYLPIDAFGRLTTIPPSIFQSNSSSIQAAELIDATDDLLIDDNIKPIIIRNKLSSADESTRTFSESIVPTMAILYDKNGTMLSRIFHRPPLIAELLLIASILSLIHGIGNIPSLSGRLPLTLLTLTICILHFILVPTASTWPPTIPLLIAVLIAIPFCPSRKKSSIPPIISGKKIHRRSIKNKLRKSQSADS